MNQETDTTLPPRTTPPPRKEVWQPPEIESFEIDDITETGAAAGPDAFGLS